MAKTIAENNVLNLTKVMLPRVAADADETELSADELLRKHIDRAHTLQSCYAAQMRELQQIIAWLKQHIDNGTLLVDAISGDQLASRRVAVEKQVFNQKTALAMLSDEQALECYETKTADGTLTVY